MSFATIIGRDATACGGEPVRLAEARGGEQARARVFSFEVDAPAASPRKDGGTRP